MAMLRKIKTLFTTGRKQEKITRNISGKNNMIENHGRLSNVEIDIKGDNNKIIIGKGTVIKNIRFYIRGNHHIITIGENCYFGRGEFWMEDQYGIIDIKNKVTVQEAGFALTEQNSKILIGEDCMISNHVEIRTGDSHSIIEQATGKRINPAANVILENHLWVGAHVKILKGVTIGHDSIIGIASLVTNNVPPNSIAAGIPAKLIREGIGWTRERRDS